MRCVQPIGETGKNGHSLIQHIIPSLFDLLLLKKHIEKKNMFLIQTRFSTINCEFPNFS